MDFVSSSTSILTTNAMRTLLTALGLADRALSRVLLRDKVSKYGESQREEKKKERVG